VADKWAVLVIAAIAEGHHRNGALLRRIDGISESLQPLLASLCIWAIEHIDDVACAQAACAL
jgi:DNA-binding HxlR family transcriptional regulator